MSPTDRDNDLIGSVESLPAFRCTESETGAWYFRCTCGDTHFHTSREGRRKGHCEQHRERGYFLLSPEPEDEVSA